MKLHRFFGEFNFSQNKIKIKDKEIVHQLHSVLRAKPGREIELINKQGQAALVEIMKIGGQEIEVEVKEVVESKNDMKEVILCLAILKRENFELSVQKATEIGVTKIIPIITKRTVKTGLKQERLEKIITEAVEQSGRTTRPELSEIKTLEEAMEETANLGERYVFDEKGDSLGSTPSESIVIFVGPEGGWDEKELEAFKEADCNIVSLGQTTLRGETAAVIASYLAVYAL